MFVKKIGKCTFTAGHVSNDPYIFCERGTRHRRPFHTHTLTLIYKFINYGGRKFGLLYHGPVNWLILRLFYSAFYTRVRSHTQRPLYARSRVLVTHGIRTYTRHVVNAAIDISLPRETRFVNDVIPAPITGEASHPWHVARKYQTLEATR